VRTSSPCASCLLLITAFLLVTTHRLPAPIFEAPAPSATPISKQPKAKPRIKSSENERPQAAQTAPKRAASFAGTWTGTAQGQGNTTFGKQANTSTYSIQISPDEKTLSVNQKGNYYSNVRLSDIACRRQKDSLTWSYETTALVRVTGLCTLHLKADGTAELEDERRYHSVDQFILKITGTLLRQ